MKTLILIRHAKSSWKNQLPDELRPLKKRGRMDAELVAMYTQKLNLPINVVYISPAKRTTETAAYFIDKWEIAEKMCHTEDLLYDFSGSDLIHFIKCLDDRLQKVMLFGHNFALTNFVNTFGSLAIDNVPTCGFVVIQFDIDSWAALKKGKTVYTLFPKELKT